MKRKLLKFICALTIAVLFGCTAFGAYAMGGANLTKTGSVAVTVTADGEAVEGASFSAYFAAAAVERDGEVVFEYTGGFGGYGGKISNIQTSEELNALAEYAESSNISAVAQMITDENGQINFNNLTLGAYLIVQTKAVDGYDKCEPFLAYIPYYENGEWFYVTDASPKAEVQKLTDITIKKVWNDGKTSHENVKINLLLNGETVKTVTLGSENGWTATLSDMPKSDSYSVEEVNIPDGYTPTYTCDGATFTVTNNSTLIKTGQLIWPVPVFALAGILLVALGITAVKRSKNDA